MGKLVEGRWTTQWYDTKNSGGRFVRESSSFRETVSADGPFYPEPDRYHLFISQACPWAHRTLLVRELKGLRELISVSGCEALMLDEGWRLSPDDAHPLPGVSRLYEVYQHAASDYTGRVTVPILWDKRSERIVNNESSQIIRIFNVAFNGLTGNTLDLYPEALRLEIDEVNERVYRDLNNGVYRCGFATTQSAYDEAAVALFDTLDWLEERLTSRQWLVGERQTEADWRLFPTLIRFDAIYHFHFKCTRRRISDYPALSRYLERLLAVPGVAETVDLDHAKRHYFGSHPTINPHGVIPLTPTAVQALY